MKTTGVTGLIAGIALVTALLLPLAGAIGQEPPKTVNYEKECGSSDLDHQCKTCNSTESSDGGQTWKCTGYKDCLVYGDLLGCHNIY